MIINFSFFVGTRRGEMAGPFKDKGSTHESRI
jgi:hypothetical protein